jgi:N-acetylmuramic acid 6-phosphate etherase
MTVDARAAQPVTEGRLAASVDLDLRSTHELVELINDEDATVASAVRAAAAALSGAIEAIVERLERGGRLIYVGGGTSGRLAAADASECAPTFGVEPGLVLALVAEVEALEDDADAGASATRSVKLGPDDALVALSASGRTPFVLGAVAAARDVGALTVGVVCVSEAPLADVVDHAVTVVVGPEVIAGSTRMKAGTAQKLVLNTISTVSMVRLGKTYGNLMVDVVGANAKLRARARRTVELATGAADADVDAALDAAGGDAKVAIVSLLAAIDAAAARERLDRNDGVVRRSLAG